VNDDAKVDPAKSGVVDDQTRWTALVFRELANRGLDPFEIEADFEGFGEDWPEWRDKSVCEFADMVLHLYEGPDPAFGHPAPRLPVELREYATRLAQIKRYIYSLT
jgi:hypothetical protein